MNAGPWDPSEDDGRDWSEHDDEIEPMSDEDFDIMTGQPGRAWLIGRNGRGNA